MRIASTAAPTAPAAPAVPSAPDPGDVAWTNPAASAALRSTSDLLQGIEDGIVRNFRAPDMVRSFAIDLRSTLEILESAATAITTDASKENDAFLPLVSTAGEGISFAEARLSSQNFAATWPVERGDILAAVRRARALSRNVADQLDPRSTTPR